LRVWELRVLRVCEDSEVKREEVRRGEKREEGRAEVKRY